MRRNSSQHPLCLGGEDLERDGEGHGGVAEGGGGEDCTSGCQEQQIKEEERLKQRLWTRSLHILHEIWSGGSLLSWKPRLQVLQDLLPVWSRGFLLRSFTSSNAKSCSKWV